MLAIRIQSKALDDISAKAAAIGQGDKVALAGAEAARELSKKHLYALSRTRHRAAAPTNFYEDAATSLTDVQNLGSGVAAFQINKTGLAQRWLGGDIKAGAGISSASGGPTKYLAIPARDEAIGRRPKDFPDLEFIPRPVPGRGMLVEKLLTRLTGARGQRLKNPSRGADARTQGGLVMFWLVDEVHQEADPTVLPTQDEFQAVAVNAMESYLSDLLRSN